MTALAFVAKVRDVVALYLNSPDKALVLFVDAKRQIQAPDRTQPSLPLSFGIAESHTHDYKCHGTITLFAAPDLATGEVIGKRKRRQRTDARMNYWRYCPKSARWCLRDWKCP